MSLWNKRLQNCVSLVTVVFLVTACIHYYGFHTITQESLEAASLARQLHSSYNPYAITHLLYRHLNREDVTLGDSRGLYFHWDDWVDLSPGDRVLNRYREWYPGGQCDMAIERFAGVNGYWMESHDKKVLRGMANMYCSMPIPEKVFVPIDSAYLEVPVVAKHRLGPGKIPTAIGKRQVLEKMAQLQTNIAIENQGSSPIRHLQKTVHIHPSEFIFDPEIEIAKLESKLAVGVLAPQDHQYLEFLKHANQLVETSDKYFKYPWIISDVIQGRSHHLAYPFFKGFISDRERQSVIHHMVRAWFQFAELQGFASWINYGSLLGWAYNGVNMPWDTDIDIQMPIRQLDRMGRYFNKSIVVEDPRYGNAKYFLEVAPTYVKQGNGRNFIDARFIDINSGLYIDISALSHTTFEPPQNVVPDQEHLTMVNCKNWNWHSLEELLPIRHTYFEGASVYIPHNVTQILSRKYGQDSFTTKLNFMGHNYQKDLRLWVPDRECKTPPSGSRFDNRGELTREGACGSIYVQDEYDITKECSQRHLELNGDLDVPRNYDTLKMGDLPIFRKDPWDYLNDINKGEVTNDRWYVRQQVVA
ncbi:uncharacterized protein CANTADRAFT_55805 [Suhomyces tanzawaensis NRRL Y-17324]|uniref:LicD/FKTN/FKRP nucleotidyltransferase domain-containing protein n=1 Tax=Suhomyces tanzawaensis NRRL Y-17324 TaxID=984487 RepID=A0A1E4SDG9_9ASCO|nr:uncharacterized protein CANTADRAFT_55805 [Suhomyces tanzawaensis NRRL Y-17324]ODV77560.1 hypothetical protein CANTADRAFT_55805 [Suhomyces tanzawaensis NRRL Y-17324]